MSKYNINSILTHKSLLYFLLIIWGVTSLTPLVWMVGSSFKSPGEDETAFFPQKPTWDNYVKAVTELPFGRFFFNSLAVALMVTFGQVFTSALSGFAFARIRFPGRNKIFFAYLATMMIPAAVMMVPLFSLLTKMPNLFNWIFHTTYFTSETYFLGKWFSGSPLGVDSYFVLIMPSLFNPYGTFLMRQFFLSIPRELDEAALIDGCSWFQIFRQIAVPMSKPAIATLATFTFMGSWRNFLWPLIMTNSVEMKPLPVGLAQLMGVYLTDWPLLMAGSMIMIIPILVVFVLCQKWFVSGINLGAVKG